MWVCLYISILSFACATATGAVRVSPPESLTSSWNGPEAPGAFSHHGPSVVPREAPHQDGVPDQASQRVMQHGRRQGRSLGSNSPSPAQSQEMPQPRTADAGIGNSSRPDSAAYKAKVKLKHGSCVMLNLVFFSFVVPPLLLTPFPITQTQLRNKAGKDLQVLFIATSLRCIRAAICQAHNCDTAMICVTVHSSHEGRLHQSRPDAKQYDAIVCMASGGRSVG